MEVAKGTGFSGDVIFNIYAPRGTKMMYCVPFSGFGNGSGRNWDGIIKQQTFGSESEMLLQRSRLQRLKNQMERGILIWTL